MKHFLPIPTFLLISGLSLATKPTLGQQTALTALYVNDAATSNDVYTQAAGNDLTGNGTPEAPFATVGRALQTALAGATIYVDAGTYTERVVLDKTVHLRGAGTATNRPDGATIFNAGLPQSGARSHEVGLLLTAPGGTVAAPLVISGFTIQAYDLGIETNGSARANVVVEDVEILDQRQYGIFWNSLGGAENLTFRRVHIARTAVDPADVRINYNGSSSPAGRGLFIVNGTKRQILIEGGTYEQNRRAGIDINDGSVSDLIIRDVLFSQNGGGAIALLGAGGLRDAAGNFLTPAALIERNTIRNNGSNGMELKSVTGNGQASGPGSFVVRENVITRLTTRPDPLPDGLPEDIPTSLIDDNAAIAFIDRDRGVIQAGGGVTGDLLTGGAYLANNTLEGYIASEQQSSLSSGINGFGIVLEGSHNRVIGNQITQCQIGIQVQERPTNSTGVGTPFFDINRNTQLATLDNLIQDNKLENCAQALVAVNLTTPVAAPLNWLGSTEASQLYGPDNQNGLVATISKDGNTFMREAPTSAAGRIAYSPFLHSNQDAATDAGFQGDRSYLHVDGASPALVPGTSLQQGLELLTANGTLSAIAGTYDEALTVNKAFTLTATGGTTLRDLTLAGNTLTLGAPFNLSGNLTLTSGRVVTTSTNLLSLLATATATAGNATSYVDGPLRKIGNQSFVFPLGKNGQWARVGISAPNAANTGFTAEYQAPQATSTTTDVTLAAPLHNISAVDAWQLTQDGGASENVRVQLFWENAFRSGIDAFTNDLQVARYDGTSWVTAGHGELSGELMAGAVTSADAVGQFGTFTLGSLSADTNPLVTELAALKATEVQPNVVQLDWTTSDAVAVRGFDIERSYDQQEWQKVGAVASRPATPQRAYTYQDRPDRTNVTAYYRLQQVLASGNRVSTPTAVNLTGVTLPTKAAVASTTFSLYPNPATRQVQVALPSTATGTITLTLFDLTGRTVLTQTLPAKSDATLPLPASLPTGTYMVRVHGQGFADSVVRLVKQ
ncbi:T9SS type A sorting domain-containing protein [Hymenobacter profundi]|uniref:Right-handed parallel beta-helix repeat-containing protein n=1 Tax=Hymenobacter profundi TaxID=1982110 RepID=A0ABS6WX17_9BACT|nr:T9SS type A sorting domain-containing protein [Hymenobacter profundi]MBW3127616.1 right-handed parallel beta-helix repeat-containing protein [Hymenobacter profundi]